MADVLSFVQSGWQNIWKQKTIWLLSTLPILTGLLFIPYNRDKQDLALLCIYFFLSLVSGIFSVISLIGVPYLAYNFSIGRSVTIQETLFAVRKFLWRILGCSCLGLLLLLPLFFLVYAFALGRSQPVDAVNTATLVLLPLSVFSCLWDFSVFGFFENDWGIRKSFENAWSLFTSHFGVLASFGVFTAVIFQLLLTVSGILTVVLQSGFGPIHLEGLNYLFPSTTLGKNALFILINGAIQTISYTFNKSALALAYLKYNGRNISPITRTA